VDTDFGTGALPGISWRRANPLPRLGPNACHLWLAELRRFSSVEPDLIETLDADERRRRERYATTALRARFAIAHGTLRSVLGRYLDCSPKAVRIRRTPLGKPCLAVPSSIDLQFSMTYSRDIVIIAVSRLMLGVDVEAVRPRDDLASIISYSCTSREREFINSLGSADARLAAFYRAWTCKEALVKALGVGLHVPPAHIPVLAGLDQAFRIQTVRYSGWVLQTFAPLREYIGALATAGAVGEVAFLLA